MDFNPSEWAIAWLESKGIPADLAAYEDVRDSELDALIDAMLTRKGRLFAFIARLLRLNSTKAVLEMESNVAKTLARVNASKKVAAMAAADSNYKESRAYKETVVRNVRNTMVGSLGRGMALWCQENIPSEDLKKIKIRWLPSHAMHHDIDHARHYGQTMSLYKAFRIVGNDQGFAVRYGCKCGARVVAGADILERYLLRSPYKKLIP